MTRAEDLINLQAKGFETEDAPAVQAPHPDGYDTLQDPDVAKSNRRPRGRFLTAREKFLSKKQTACSHCNSCEHNIATCHNLHIDKSQFKKRKAASKKNPGASTVSTAEKISAKRQRKKSTASKVQGSL